jgi:hypothetical protein
MGRKKLSTTVYLTLGQATALALLSAKGGAPVAHHIRVALDHYLSRQVSDGQISRADLPGLVTMRQGTATSADSVIGVYSVDEKQEALLRLLDSAAEDVARGNS